MRSRPDALGQDFSLSATIKSGYLLVYRENNGQNKSWIETWLPAGAKIKCMPVLGNGKAMTTVVGRLGTVEISLPAINDFVMYKYEIK